MATKFQIALKEERVINLSFKEQWFGIKGFYGRWEEVDVVPHRRRLFPIKVLLRQWKVLLTICSLLSIKSCFRGHFSKVWNLTQKSSTIIFSIVLIKNRRTASLKARLEEHHILQDMFQWPPNSILDRRWVLYKNEVYFFYEPCDY